MESHQQAQSVRKYQDKIIVDVFIIHLNYIVVSTKVQFSVFMPFTRTENWTKMYILP